jgi:hypothetical protein
MLMSPRANRQTTVRAFFTGVVREKYKGADFGRMSPIVIGG